MQPPMWQFKKWHTRGWFKFLMNYNMCITNKLGSGVGLSENIRHSPSLHIISVTFCNIFCPVWKWRSDKWHTTPYEMCHLPNCHNTSCGSLPPVLEWSYGSRHNHVAQSTSNPCVISFRTYSNLDVYVHMIAHISTRCYVYVDMLTVSTRWYETISTRFICSYSIWDDEWWWESRLDFSMSNLEQISMRLTRLIIRIA